MVNLKKDSNHRVERDENYMVLQTMQPNKYWKHINNKKRSTIVFVKGCKPCPSCWVSKKISKKRK